MDSMQSFWAVIQSVLDTEVLGLNVLNYLLAIVVFGVFFFGRHLFVYIVIAWIRAFSKRTKWSGDGLLNVIEGPLSLMPVVVGIFALSQILVLEDSLQVMAMRAMQSLVAISIFWVAYNMVDILAERMGRLGRAFTPVMIEWVARVLRVLFVAIGVASILEMWGVNVTAIIAGLGLFGVAVALGAQDLFKNLIAGTLVVVERRFNRGDWIKVDGIVEGTVEAIGFRSTVVRRFDKAPVFVPNAKFSDNAVTNFTAMTHRRISWKIGLEYSSTAAQLKQVRDQIEAYILETDDFAKPEDVSTFVRIDSFNDSSIDLMLYCFTNTTKWGEWLAIKEKLALRVKEIVEEAGTGFAFPSQSVYVEQLPSMDGK